MAPGYAFQGDTGLPADGSFPQYARLPGHHVDLHGRAPIDESLVLHGYCGIEIGETVEVDRQRAAFNL